MLSLPLVKDRIDLLTTGHNSRPSESGADDRLYPNVVKLADIPRMEERTSESVVKATSEYRLLELVPSYRTAERHT
jgi:hypothetical protein